MLEHCSQVQGEEHDEEESTEWEEEVVLAEVKECPFLSFLQDYETQ